MVMWCTDFGLLPTLSDYPPIRANAVVVVVTVVVVDVAGRRNAKRKIQRTTYVVYLLSLVLQAKAMCFTSVTIEDQFATVAAFIISNLIDSSMKNRSSSQ